MARGARVLQLFLGKGEFTLLPAGLSARVAASCTASDSNQNSYALAQIAKTLTAAAFQPGQNTGVCEVPTRPRTKSGFLRSRKGRVGTSGRRFDEIPT